MCPAVEKDPSNPDEGDSGAANGGAGSHDRAESPTVDDGAATEGAGESGADRAHKEQPTSKRRQVSVSLRALIVGIVIVCLTAAVGVVTWLYVDARTQLNDQARQVADGKRAEQVALDYAVDAAVMDYRDLGPWKQNLVKNTVPKLNEKLTKAAEAMEQILLPMQWSSTAEPLAAKVRSHENGVYVVDAFVSVMTKTVQADDTLRSTATYSVTIDSNDGWQISDVGGIVAVVGDK